MTDPEDGQVRAFEARGLRSRGEVVLTPGTGWVDVTGRSGTVRYQADEVEARVSTDLEQGRVWISERPADPDDIVYGRDLLVLADISPAAQRAVRALQVVACVVLVAFVAVAAELYGRVLAGVGAAMGLIPAIVRWRARVRPLARADTADPAEAVAHLLERSGIAVEQVRFVGVGERHLGLRMRRWELNLGTAAIALAAAVAAMVPTILVVVVASALSPDDLDRSARKVALVVATPVLALLVWHASMMGWAHLGFAGRLRDRMVARYRRPRRPAIAWTVAYGVLLALIVVFGID